MTERLDDPQRADKPREPENRFGQAVALLLKASDWMERNDPEVKQEIDAFLETVHPLECGPLATTEVARSAVVASTPVAWRYRINGLKDAWKFTDEPLTSKFWEKEPLYLQSARMGCVDDLAMLVRQLVHKVKNLSPDSSLADRAMDYLKRHGLEGSPLREENATHNATDRNANG